MLFAESYLFFFIYGLIYIGTTLIHINIQALFPLTLLSFYLFFLSLVSQIIIAPVVIISSKTVSKPVS